MTGSEEKTEQNECMKKNARASCVKSCFCYMTTASIGRGRCAIYLLVIALVSSLCVVVVHAGTNGGASVCAGGGGGRFLTTRLRFLTHLFPRKLTSG